MPGVPIPWGANSDWCDGSVPTYALACPECGNRFELFLMRIIRDADKVCPECGSRDVTTGIGGGVIGKKAESGSCGQVGGFG